MRLTTSSIVAIVVVLIGIAVSATHLFSRPGSYIVAMVLLFLARAMSVYKWFDD
jgi:putative effector of murein hydrolase LrgA (UPF0299 family)